MTGRQRRWSQGHHRGRRATAAEGVAACAGAAAPGWSPRPVCGVGVDVPLVTGPSPPAQRLPPSMRWGRQASDAVSVGRCRRPRSRQGPPRAGSVPGPVRAAVYARAARDRSANSLTRSTVELHWFKVSVSSSEISPGRQILEGISSIKHGAARRRDRARVVLWYLGQRSRTSQISISVWEMFLVGYCPSPRSRLFANPTRRSELPLGPF